MFRFREAATLATDPEAAEADTGAAGASGHDLSGQPLGKVVGSNGPPPRAEGHRHGNVDALA